MQWHAMLTVHVRLLLLPRCRVSVAARIASFVAMAATHLAEIFGRFLYALTTIAVMGYKLMAGMVAGEGGGAGLRQEGITPAFDEKRRWWP